MKPLRIREVTLGTGRPKICVPLTGKTEGEILSQAKAAMEKGPDLLEWRVDFFHQMEKEEAVSRVCKELGDKIGQIPLIFTFRSEKEGGNRQISLPDYVDLLKMAGSQPRVDLIDVELFMEKSRMSRLIKELQQMGKKVIASNHHFEGTPKIDIMETILNQMEDAGADLRKLAVMPRKKRQVWELLWATVQAAESGEKPVITMAMGQLGGASRVLGELSGSCVTFGTAGQSSAPGQMEVEQLKEILWALRLDADEEKRA